MLILRAIVLVCSTTQTCDTILFFFSEDSPSVCSEGSAYQPSEDPDDSSCSTISRVAPSVSSDEVSSMPLHDELSRFLMVESDEQVSSPPTNGQQVASTSNKSKRVWNRKNACYFCERLVMKMARHL